MLKLILCTFTLINFAHMQATTWYTHCYKYTCKNNQPMVKPDPKIVGSFEGTHKCFDPKNKTYTPVIKTIDYDQCNTKPCDGLEPCQGYLTGLQKSRNAIDELINKPTNSQSHVK